MASLLARIQSEVGPDAKVVSADKVRRGGVGGFFAKETYEIVVEVPDGLLAGAATPAPSRRGGAKLLLGRLGNGVPEAAANKSSFEEMLRGLIQTSEPVLPETITPTAVVPAAVVPGAAAPAEADLPGALALSDAPTVALAASAHLPAPRDEDLSDLLALATGQEADTATVLERTPLEAEFDTAEEWLSGRPSPRKATGSPVRSRPGRASGGTRPAARRRASIPPARLRSSLRSLGVPATFIPADSRRGLVAALVRSLAALPEPPSVDLEAGDVLAVVGCPQKAPRLAARVAMTLGLDPAALPAATASPSGTRVAITSAESARQQATAWSGRPAPTVLWIDAPVGSGREAWALRVLEALEPRVVWGVVDAARKPEDVKAWAGAVGGLDAIAVEDLDATTTPASVLSVGVPVVMADGRRSTPELWAALLADRLAEDAA